MNVFPDACPISGEPCFRYEVTYVTRNGARVKVRGWFHGTRPEAQAAAERAYEQLRKVHGRRIRWKGDTGFWRDAA